MHHHNFHKNNDSNNVLVEASRHHLIEHFRVIAQDPKFESIQVGNFWAIRSKHAKFNWNRILGHGMPSSSELEDLLTFVQNGGNGLVPLVWFSAPKTQELEQRLSAYGLESVGSLTSMGLNIVEHRKEYHEIPKGFQFSKVQDEKAFAQWIKILTMTWQMDVKATKQVFSRAFQLSRETDYFHLFISSFNGTTAGCCVVHLIQDVAGCYWDCVLPEFRGRGFGKAQVVHRLQWAQQNGAKKVVAHCLETSRSLYQALGFGILEKMALFKRG